MKPIKQARDGGRVAIFPNREEVRAVRSPALTSELEEHLPHVFGQVSVRFERVYLRWAL